VTRGVTLSVEEGLRRAEDRAALLRYTLDLAAASAEVPEPPVLSGLADLCGDLEDVVRQVRQAIDADVLGRELASEPTDDDPASKDLAPPSKAPKGFSKNKGRRMR
jgi:hypothetical protein